MAELLLEILSAEIPARMQARAAEELKRLGSATSKDAGPTCSRADADGPARRPAPGGRRKIWGQRWPRT